MKKYFLALVAVLALGALVGPSMASADGFSAYWTCNGDILDDGGTAAPGDPNCSIETAGTLMFSAPGAGVTITCDVTDEGTVWNDFSESQGTAALDNVSNLTIINSTCTTNQANCTVTATTQNFGWATDAWANNETGATGFHDHIRNVDFTNTFSGPLCAFNGLSVTATGTLKATVVQPGSDGPCGAGYVSGLQLTGLGSGALATSPNIGPAFISGTDAIVSVNGDPDQCVDLHRTSDGYPT